MFCTAKILPNDDLKAVQPGDMTSAAPAGRKPTLCRFFVNTRSCVYGDECQFLHQSPDTMSGVHPPAAYPSSLPAQSESVDNHGMISLCIL